jgi:hypothetical protein
MIGFVMLRSITIAITSLSLSWSMTLNAQEVAVYWQPPVASTESQVFANPVECIRGVLAGFDKSRLILTPSGTEQPKTLRSDLVVGLHVEWPEGAMQTANANFRDGRYVEAIKQYESIINGPDIQQWQQKLLLLQITSAATQLENLTVAAKAFQLLHSLSVPTFAYAYMPLCWSSDRTSPNIANEVNELAAATAIETKLIVASWQVSIGETQSSRATLESIRDADDTLLSQLASCQLWRLEVPEKFVNEKLNDAIAFRDKLPMSLQAGPTATIADRIERSGSDDLAFQYWLEAAMLADQNELPVFRVAIRHLESIAGRTNRREDWQRLKKVFE